jgi:threonine/homoserine/homoserine lactone efflux protein
MSIGYVAIQRGVRLSSAGNPRDALAFLERRLRVERLAAHLVRWTYAGLCLVFVFLFPRVVAGHSAPEVEMAISFPAMFVVLIVTFSAPWWVARRNRPYQEEIDRWRRWMDEQQL